MIEILLADKTKAKVICAANGIEMLPETLIYCAAERETQLGLCVFEVAGDRGRIRLIKMAGEGLEPIADGLLRSALSLMAERGVGNVSCRDGVEPKLLFGVGFHEKEGILELELSKSFFAGC